VHLVHEVSEGDVVVGVGKAEGAAFSAVSKGSWPVQRKSGARQAVADSISGAPPPSAAPGLPGSGRQPNRDCSRPGSAVGSRQLAASGGSRVETVFPHRAASDVAAVTMAQFIPSWYVMCALTSRREHASEQGAVRPDSADPNPGTTLSDGPRAASIL
jgi:hypothetical protein